MIRTANDATDWTGTPVAGVADRLALEAKLGMGGHDHEYLPAALSTGAVWLIVMVGLVVLMF